MQQLASILLDNAAKYCDNGGEIAVRLGRRPNGKDAVLSVSNTYSEGKNEDISRFFERFYRQDESHNSANAGFGIGLSMAAEITERLKGNIRAEYLKDTICFKVELYS